MRTFPSAIALGLVLVATSGCDTGERLARLEKQNAELKSEMEKNRAATDYDFQSRCSRDAKTWFNENWSGRDKTTRLLTYTNHYHKASNKCFIMVEFHFALEPQASWVNDMTLWDVYENSKYGQFSETHMVYYKPKFETNDSVSTCEVLGTKCKTIDEFNGLLRPYLNN